MILKISMAIFEWKVNKGGFEITEKVNFFYGKIGIGYKIYFFQRIK